MKNILVVGGTSGITQNLIGLLRPDNNIIIASRRSIPEQSENGVTYVKYDAASDELELGQLESLDGLVYGPGTINLKPFNRLSVEEFRADLEVNLLGAVRTIQSALPKLKKSPSSSIVLYSTVAVGQGMPYHASVASAKGAVEGLGRSLAAELAPKIRVNVIAPSIVDTPLAGRLLSSDEKKEASGRRHPLKRVGESKDIAEMTQFLLSDKSSWMTGQILQVDGGMSSIRLL